MKKLFVLFVLLSVTKALFPQLNDLIVTKEGDSVRCQIDSVSNNVISFKVKAKNTIVNTYVDSTQVMNYQFNFYPEEMDKAFSVYQISPYKHSLFVGLTLVAFTVNYEQIFRVDSSNRFSLRGGFGYDFLNQKMIFMAECNYILGKRNNFAEVGLGYQAPEKFPGMVIFRLGYRLESRQGVLFKVYPMLFFNLANDKDNVFEDEWKVFGGVGVSIGKLF